MKYQYFYGNSTQYKSRCLVEILDGPADAPRVIMTDDGHMYERVELDHKQAGYNGQCNECVFGDAGDSEKGKCPPIHGCGINENVSVKVYDDNGALMATLNPGKTTHHIRWDRYIPADPVEKIDIVNVEI